MTLLRGLGRIALVVGVAALSVTGTLWFTDSDPGHVANSIITAAAALSVAFLTIVTTDRRQTRQLAHDAARQRETLDAESARQRETLDAESARQRDRLRHERELRDLEAARKLIDDTTELLGRLSLPMHTAMATAGTAAKHPENETLIARADQAFSHMQDLVFEAAEWEVLFHTRLGKADALSETTIGLWRTLGEMGRLDSEAEDIRSGTLAQGLEDGRKRYREAETAFVAAVHERTGLQLPE